MIRIIKRERIYTHYGYTVRNEKGSLDKFFPIFDDEGFELVPTEFIDFLNALISLGYTIKFE